MIWAVFSAWRGDLRLFARIAECAVKELKAAGHPHDCSIKFFVRKDVEAFASAKDLLDGLTLQAQRRFQYAYILVGTPPLTVTVEFARRAAPDRYPAKWFQSVSVIVTTEDQRRLDTAKAVREAVANIVTRGGITGGSTPTLGEGERAWYRCVQAAARTRGVEVGFIYLLVYVALAAGVLPIFGLSLPDRGVVASLIPIATGFLGLVIAANPSFVYPAIEISDLPPGRRFAALIAIPALLGVATGLVVVLLQKPLGL